MNFTLAILYSAVPILFVVGLLLLWNKEEPSKKKEGWKGDDCQ
tara:strand:- start:400 stop:528 length:129 start_codon:yes stop_codon:yes gene_type:complete